MSKGRFAGFWGAALLALAGASAAAAAAPDCGAQGWSGAAAANAASLRTLAWAPFGRAETGWDAYVAVIQQEIGTACGPESEAFAAAYAAFEQANGLPPDGLVTEADFLILKGRLQGRRPFVRRLTEGGCPETADVIAQARPDESYAGKVVHARPDALAAWRRMAADARAHIPEIAADPMALTIFSGYRSPSLDAARCARDGNCDGVARARCSAHRTGLALDLYVGQAPGYSPDSTAEPSRLFLSKTAAYRWLVANAGRYGFVNYAFEPWHWEWTDAAP